MNAYIFMHNKIKSGRAAPVVDDHLYEHDPLAKFDQ
jgi:hypothetical protein